ncbi:MAG: outer membrane protein assembly factor BamA [Deltaproteobacteria bacterium]|nr:outer membrane protein assembly factor BamA [Deltaproteobacteria bacterium]
MQRVWLCLALLLIALTGHAGPAADAPSIPASAEGGPAFGGGALIEEIALSGTFPFLDRQIRRHIALRPGDPFDPTTLDEQITRIKEYYEREGYFGTTITSSTKWRPYTQGVVVTFTIARGHGLRWGNIQLDGNTLLPAGRIHSVFSVWDYYSPRRMKEGVRRLARLYQRRGYPKARVRVTQLAPNQQQRRMDVTMRVTEGPHLAVNFVGNAHLPDSMLRSTVTFFTEGRLDPFEVEQSVAALTRRYVERGFADVMIRAERAAIDPTHERVTFHIVEGPRRTIWGIDFAGNNARGSGTLREQMLNQPLSIFSRGALNRELLREDLAAIEDYYHREGFLDTTLGEPQIRLRNADRSFHIDIPVAEGPRYTIGRVTFTGNFHAAHDALLERLQLRPTRPADRSRLAEDAQSVALFFDDHGYPHAHVEQVVTLDRNTEQLHIDYHIDERMPVHIGAITISGDFITSQRAIRQALTIKEGDLYSDRKILESQLNLRRLGAFRNVAFERHGLEAQRDAVDLQIRIEEEKPFMVDVDLGYATDTGFSGALQFTNLNSFGWAKRTQLSLLGGNRRARAELAWIDPRLLGTDLLLTTSAWIDRNQDIAFDVVQAGGAVGLYRQYHRTGFVLRYKLARNRLLGGDPTQADLEGRRNTTISQLTAGMTFDTRDNFANPTRGFYCYGEADLYNELRGSRADFVRLRGGLNHYLNLWHGIMLSQSGRVGGIQPIGPANIPITERLFLGGDDTIRGFAEDRVGPLNAAGDPLGANVQWVYNAELSVPLFDNFRAATFFDIGSLTNTFSEINRTTVRNAVGVGLRYATPVGPLRAEYAVKLDPQPGESSGRFHFTFGHLF